MSKTTIENIKLSLMGFFVYAIVIACAIELTIILKGLIISNDIFEAIFLTFITILGLSGTSAAFLIMTYLIYKSVNKNKKGNK